MAQTSSRECRRAIVRAYLGWLGKEESKPLGSRWAIVDDEVDPERNEAPRAKFAFNKLACASINESATRVRHAYGTLHISL